MKDKYRLEKKFLVRSLESEHLEDILSLLPFNFIEIFAEITQWSADRRH